MATVLTNIYEEFFNAYPDSRTKDWFLIPSPVPTLISVSLYALFVYFGRKWMKNREAYQLNSALMCYNFVLVLLNFYIFYEFLMTSWLNPAFSLFCQNVDRSDNPTALRLANVCWWFYFSKLIELADTVFFVLRKKDNQITFLHVYHHFTMPILWYIGVRNAPGGESYFCASINSFIHVLMYTYYLLSAMGPHMQKYLWWKRYMTVLQLAQFWGILMHTSYAIYLDCGYPNRYNWALILYDFSHILLFSNFYYQTYTKKSRATKQQREENSVKSNGVHQNGITNGVRKELTTQRRIVRKES